MHLIFMMLKTLLSTLTETTKIDILLEERKCWVNYFKLA